MSTKNAIIQVRQGAASDWTSSNPLLLLGETGLEVDTGKEKLGTGTDLWNSLDYKHTKIGTFLTADGFLKNQTASAWVNFNGTGTVTIRDSFNVLSITDNGPGDYTINFATAMDNANYVAVVTCGNFSTDAIAFGFYSTRIYSTTSLRINTTNSGGSLFDFQAVNVIIFGGRS